MAHFFDPADPYSKHYGSGAGEKPGKLPSSGNLPVGLWASDDVTISSLVVKPAPADAARISLNAGAAGYADAPGVRFYTLVATTRGEACTIEARLGEGGPVQASMPVAWEPRQDVMDRAWDDHIRAVQQTLTILRKLQADINSGMADDAARSAFGTLAGVPPLDTVTVVNSQPGNPRNIAVISRYLRVSSDIKSPEFRNALKKLIEHLERNLAMPKSLRDAGLSGICSPTEPWNAANGVPFARSDKGLAPKKTHLCDTFFNAPNDRVRRDVITHELFHLFGPEYTDHSVHNTAEAFTNPHTVASIVNRLVDRTAQAAADGTDPDLTPLPSP